MQTSSWSGRDAPVSVTVHNDERATGFAEVRFIVILGQLTQACRCSCLTFYGRSAGANPCSSAENSISQGMA